MATASIPVEDTWRLEDLFADDEAFGRERETLEKDLPRLSLWQGRLGESAVNLADCLSEITATHKRFAVLRCYASLRSDTDTRVDAYQAMRQGVDLLATELAKHVAFLRPELLALEPERLEGFLKHEPRLAEHAFFLRDLLRHRPHVLGSSEEKILAETGLLTRSASSLFLVLNNVELPRPEVTLSSGETVALTPVAFHQHRTTSNREDRLRMFPAFFGAYRSFQDTLGQNLYASVKNHVFRARVRGYDSCLHAALHGDNVPLPVYRNLIAQVRERLPLLHRYLRLRTRALGVDRLEYADLYCPLCRTPPKKRSTTQARETILDSLSPLGGRYVEDLRRAFDDRWVDWHPTPGKRAGAYATGWAYDVHPYALVNFTGDYDSVSTVAHEMGHAMHSHFSNAAQPFATADYSIFVAEVASTLNEALLSAHALETCESDDERLYLVTSYLDGIRATLFRQTMFAEFELSIHDRADRGEVLTGPKLTEIYLELLRQYQGHHDGVMHVGDDYGVEWAAIPHFYYDFYVYQYSTGIVAATALAEAILAGQDGAAERYVEFLSSGGSDYPLELLRRAGVDLESSSPYDQAMNAFERRLDDLERLLDAGDAR